MDLKRPATNGETDMFYEGSNPSGVTKNREVKRNWYRSRLESDLSG